MRFYITFIFLNSHSFDMFQFVILHSFSWPCSVEELINFLDVCVVQLLSSPYLLSVVSLLLPSLPVAFSFTQSFFSTGERGGRREAERENEGRIFCTWHFSLNFIAQLGAVVNWSLHRSLHNISYFFGLCDFPWSTSTAIQNCIHCKFQLLLFYWRNSRGKCSQLTMCAVIGPVCVIIFSEPCLPCFSVKVAHLKYLKFSFTFLWEKIL